MCVRAVAMVSCWAVAVCVPPKRRRHVVDVPYARSGGFGAGIGGRCSNLRDARAVRDTSVTPVSGGVRSSRGRDHSGAGAHRRE